MHTMETTKKFAMDATTMDATTVLANHPDISAALNSMLIRDIQSVIGYRSAISVECKNGVVTLNGYFANKNDKNKALSTAIANPGVCKIINNAN